MGLGKLALITFALIVYSVFPTIASAAECTNEYDWKCDDKVGNSCVGFFLGVLGSAPTEAFQESIPDLQCGNQQQGHSLSYALRFSDLPTGAHKLRMSYGSQNVCGAATETEVVKIYKRVAENCDETGAYTEVVTLGPDGHELADYDLGESGTTDICIKIVSQETSPYRDEFLIDHGLYAHNHPVMVTTDYLAASEQTNPGNRVSGSYLDTRSSDNVRETLIEGGSQHRLVHVYEIDNIAPASSQTLVVEGSRPDNSDGDDFKILYRWSSSACTTSGIFLNSGILINSSTEQTYSATITNSSGRLCVAVDDSTGGSNNDTVSIDYVAVLKPSCP